MAAAPSPSWAVGLVFAAALAFAARGVGDFRYFGLFKRHVASRFARRDTPIYVPLCFGLAWGLFLVAL